MGKIVFNNGEDQPKITEVVNQAGGFIKFWKGSLEMYNALTSLDPDTVYIVEQNT